MSGRFNSCSRSASAVCAPISNDFTLCYDRIGPEALAIAATCAARASPPSAARRLSQARKARYQVLSLTSTVMRGTRFKDRCGLGRTKGAG